MMITVEIWSDLVCPFCYIGKRNFEAALARFPEKDQVKVVWKSFELDPSAEKNQKGDIYDLLSEKYGRDRQWAIEMNQHVVQTAAKVGLKFDMDRVIPTSSFDAHRLVQLAATKGLEDAAEERFFSAYFAEGKHLGDAETLKALAHEIGLDSKDVEQTLASSDFEKEVRRDEGEAEALNVRGVPFFVLNRKYAVSGAQPVEVFLKALTSCLKK